MELGYFTMPLHPPGSDITKTLEDDLEQIVTLDELGYKEAWIGEHFEVIMNLTSELQYYCHTLWPSNHRLKQPVSLVTPLPVLAAAYPWHYARRP